MSTGPALLAGEGSDISEKIYSLDWPLGAMMIGQFCLSIYIASLDHGQDAHQLRTLFDVYLISTGTLDGNGK
jgi:hypothetical protein